MNKLPITTSAPGSVFLAGEHAVLHGQLAIVAAVDQKIHLTLMPRNDKKLVILSDSLGEFYGQMDRLHPEIPFQFLMTTVKRYQKELADGIELKVTADFSDKVGLGSSAAVTVACLRAIHQLLGKEVSDLALLAEGIEVVKAVQGLGSGGDIAASIFGGVIAYRASPVHVEQLEQLPPLQLIYVGYKTPTAAVVDKVNRFRQFYPEICEKIFFGIGQCAENARRAIKLADWKLLGETFNAQQALMEELGVSDEVLNEVIAQLRQMPSVIGSKISGSGLGDCVVALGKVPENYFPSDARQKAIGIRLLKAKL